MLLLNALTELIRTDLLIKRIECSMESTQKRIEKMNFKDHIKYYFSFCFDDFKSVLFSRHVEEDDEIINIIKNLGPVSLCISYVQDGLIEWTNNRRIAHLKLQKVLDALLEYSYGNKYTDTPFKLGRPEIEATRLYGNKWIIFVYNSLIEILRLAKKNRIYVGGRMNDTTKVDRVIDLSYYEFLNNKIHFLQQSNDRSELKKYLSTKSFTNELKLNPISRCIASDDVITQVFLEARYEPNKLAKEVLSKMLDISERKLTYILYKRAEQ